MMPRYYWKIYTYRSCYVMPSTDGPESPGWWPSPTSSVSPFSSSCPAACPFYFHSTPWTDLFRRLFYISRTPSHTPPRHVTPCALLPPSFVVFFFRSFKRNSRRVLAVSSRAKVLPFPTLSFSLFLSNPSTRIKNSVSFGIDLVYGCSLHFFGSFVIDRATSYLATLQQKREWFRRGNGKGYTPPLLSPVGHEPINILHRIVQRPWIPQHSLTTTAGFIFPFSEGLVDTTHWVTLVIVLSNSFV